MAGYEVGTALMQSIVGTVEGTRPTFFTAERGLRLMMELQVFSITWGLQSEAGQTLLRQLDGRALQDEEGEYDSFRRTWASEEQV